MSDDLVFRFRDALLSGISALEAAGQQPLRDLWRAALGLEHVVLSDLLTEEEEGRVLESMDPGRKGVCQEIFRRLETLIENSFAASVLSGQEGMVHRTNGITENYLCLYEELARREVRLSGMTSADRVLFVGSGPFPITAIEYHRQTGCTVDCVDFVPEAVATSREVLERLRLSSGVFCRQARGEHVPADPYSIVLVGVLAQPKQEILENVASSCPVGCRILTRTTFGLRELIYQPAVFDELRLSSWRRIGTSVARGDQVLSSKLFLKES
jgi:hypothetical protein